MDRRPLYGRMSMHTFLLASLLVAFSAVAQEENRAPQVTKAVERARRSLMGRVLDSKDVPVAGAEVSFVSNLVPGLPELGDNDVLRVLSDARGRFSVDLLPGRGYSAWAWTTRNDGSRWSSRIMEDLRSGGDLDFLLLRSRPEPVLRLGDHRVGGVRRGKILYAWGGRHFVLRELAGVGEGEVTLPRMPGGKLVLRFFDEQGRPIRQERLSLEKLTPDAPLVLTPRTPRRIRIRILDGKRPLPDVRILLSLEGWTPELATTGTDGEAVFPLLGIDRKSDSSYEASCALLLQKPGYPVMQVHVTGVRGDAKTMTPYPVSMSRSHRLRGRLLDDQGRARPHMPLVMFTRSERACDQPGVVEEIPCPLIFCTENEGRFDLPGLGSHAFHRLLAIPLDGSAPILLSSSRPPARADLLLGDLKPAELTRIHLRIRDVQGRPLPEARLFLGETTRETRSVYESYHPIRLFPDSQSRASLLCSRRLRPVFTAAWQGAIVERSPDLSAAKGLAKSSAKGSAKGPAKGMLKGKATGQSAESVGAAPLDLDLRFPPAGPAQRPAHPPRPCGLPQRQASRSPVQRSRPCRAPSQELPRDRASARQAGRQLRVLRRATGPRASTRRTPRTSASP